MSNDNEDYSAPIDLRTLDMTDRALLPKNAMKEYKPEILPSGRIRYVPYDKIPISVLPIQTVGEHSAVVVVGASESGKSNWTRWSQCCNNNIAWGTVYTGTRDNGEWQKIYPERAVIQGFDGKKVERTLVHQKKMLGVKDKYNIWTRMTYDDQQGDPLWKKQVARLFFRARHFKVQTWVLVQNKNGFDKQGRGNAKFVVFCRQLSYKEIKECADEWLGSFNIRTGIELISHYTQDNHCLCMDMRTNPPKLYVSKAPHMEGLYKKFGRAGLRDVFFPLGTESFWLKLDQRTRPKTTFGHSVVSLTVINPIQRTMDNAFGKGPSTKSPEEKIAKIAMDGEEQAEHQEQKELKKQQQQQQPKRRTNNNDNAKPVFVF